MTAPGDYRGSVIPPGIHDIAFDWDPQPEVQRLLHFAREAGADVRSVLELGCGTGRLLAALGAHLSDRWGIELSREMAEAARARSGARIVAGDMCDFALERTFDLIFASANTVRHAATAAQIAGLWRCVAEHLVSGGVFIADLELGFEAEAAKLHRPAFWTLSRGPLQVRASWCVVRPPAPDTRCCTVEWEFEARSDRPLGRWSESFELRTYDADEFVRLATAAGGLEPRGIYEVRDPYLLPRTPENAVGRMLVVLQSPRRDAQPPVVPTMPHGSELPEPTRWTSAPARR